MISYFSERQPSAGLLEVFLNLFVQTDQVGLHFWEVNRKSRTRDRLIGSGLMVSLTRVLWKRRQTDRERERERESSNVHSGYINGVYVR